MTVLDSRSAPLRAAVLGAPVAHSRSPAIFAHWFRKYGIYARYGRIEVSGGELADCLQGLAERGVAGVNITVPLKMDALAHAASMSEAAARIGAANMLSFRDGGVIHADNSDGAGFVLSLRACVPDWDPAAGPAVLLGAGGAARAIADALVRAGVPELRVVNRTRARAEALAEAIPGSLVPCAWEAVSAALTGVALVVNATSLGMTGKPALNLDLRGTRRDAIVADIVYAPRRTRLLAAAAATGRRPVPGTGMLLHQARPAFEQWFGIRPEVDSALYAEVFGGRE